MKEYIYVIIPKRLLWYEITPNEYYDKDVFWGDVMRLASFPPYGKMNEYL